MISRRHLLAYSAGALALSGQALAQQALNEPTAKDPVIRNPLANRFGGPFSLTDHNGKRVTDKNYRGQYMLVYFGFTRCTDACPIDVPNLINALDLIKPLDAKVQPLFITVDPTDTADDLKEYVEAFHPKLIGLTGSEAELAAVAKAYRVHRVRVKFDAGLSPTLTGPRHAMPRLNEAVQVHGDKPHVPGQRYSINHGTLTYLMGPDGGFLTLVPHNSNPKKIADVLRTYIKTK